MNSSLAYQHPLSCLSAVYAAEIRLYNFTHKLKKVGKCKYKTFELTINASKLQMLGEGLIRGSRSEFKVFLTVR